jgi:cobaltochelatase CobN
MHLRASQPGGFTDDEGIVDLQQTPADIVILSAADSTLAMLASSIEKLPPSFPSVRLANWMQLLKPAALDLYQDRVLDHATLIIVSLLGGQSYWPYGVEQLQDWARADSSRKLILVPGDDSLDENLMALSTEPAATVNRIWQYLRQGGLNNTRQLFSFLGAEYFQHSDRWHEPEALPHCLLYLPGQASQASLSQWQQGWQQRKLDGGVCLILFYRSHLQSANTAMFDDFIEQLQIQGLRPLPVAIASLKDAESLSLVNHIIASTDVQLIINTTGFASNRVEAPELSSQPNLFQSPFAKNIPVLQLVLSSSTEADWLAQSQGLRSRDIAMQVVLPEMDGRIITRAISFKTEAYYCERAQIPVIRYQLHKERGQFVAQLAQRYCRLADKKPAQRRIALILANYPTKDGRIGNGVGLDTPQSTIEILTALKDSGYPVDDIAENGTELIKALLGSVTNNPNTLHFLPCWQSLDLTDYRHYFAQLPEQCQQAVIDQWGQPEQDPKHRAGRLMLSGMRSGETFIGIQPARGFNIDLAANYHDPDLIPPHNYLAFYFWLRHVYQVDAIIHVGKHGNLEWLPGKGTALSEQCWPDIALGPMPHFYPFIVNDPGEGAQAKRRAQAVIIDHLMPPMTRAEVYGELAELELLVDEFYQAMGLDERREKWLREQIISKAKATNLVAELSITAASSEEQLLEQLDAYLCDIKEAQIRHGLHILGRQSNNEKLSDTIVALLRLPRGSEPHNQGILHNLCDDFHLQSNNQESTFNPLKASAKNWRGVKPVLLKNQTSAPWRSEADTRERLELLALEWVNKYVVNGIEIPQALNDQYPRTTAQLDYACRVVKTALEKSVEQEITALLDGLNGKFVAPGPSGAPTRGRLDTLPTGRNFYSVDNRAIPSPAAWAIGQRSAQALLERHLQDHGDYMRELGLSVWGTATMRTGGDDIAQAFWLMGIKPIWAQGSQRVIDFEILPTQLLKRPRVDVTLRVSGFFRDAFPNVMKIYHAAVLAIAQYEESGGANTIKDNIERRTQELITDGLDFEQAQRQASYRVFGSKPGAYGAGLQGLIDERCWENRNDLADAYLNWGGYAYGSDNNSQDGIEARQAFQHRLSQLDSVVQNQDNREHDLLDSDDYYQFQGGMTNAITQLKGVAPVVYHNDHSDPSTPKIRTLKEELNRVIRSRVLNPKWITAMQEHGYKGAFEMAATVDYLFAYDATTNLIDDYQYRDVTDALVFDKNNQQFMRENNPHALEEMAERLLEATQRGLWQTSEHYAEKLQDLLLDLDGEREGNSDD